jgi:hypothetical protein
MIDELVYDFGLWFANLSFGYDFHNAHIRARTSIRILLPALSISSQDNSVARVPGEKPQLPRTRSTIRRPAERPRTATPTGGDESESEVLPGILAAEKSFLQVFEVGGKADKLTPDLFFPAV